MPISSQVPIIGYVANGVTKSFAFPFAILSVDDLKVKVGADVVTAGFSIAGVGDRDGGSVTFTDAPASLTPIILYREVTLDRTTDYQENGDLLAIVLDDDLDRIWMALQDQLLLSDRALRSPIGETLQQLPPASERALMALAFDADGNPIVVRGTNDGGAALALDLMDTAPGKGAALVGADDGASGSLWTTVAGFIAFLLSSLGASVIGFIQDGAGAIKRWVLEKLRETVSVKDFGAKGDADPFSGVGTDDSAAIQAALYSTGSGGDRVLAVLLPDGAYYSSTDIFIPEGVTVYGRGPWRAKVHFASGKGFRMVSGGTYDFPPEMYGLSVYSSGGAGLKIESISGASVHGTWFSGTTGIEIQGTADIAIYDNVFDGTANGVVITAGSLCNNISIQNNSFTGNAYGITLKNARDVRITGNAFRGDANHNIHILSNNDSNTLIGVVISGNTFYTAAGTGAAGSLIVKLNGTLSNISVTGNTMDGCRAQGIFCDSGSVSGVLISGNIISNVGGDAISFTNTGTQISIKNNILRNGIGGKALNYNVAGICSFMGNEVYSANVSGLTGANGAAVDVQQATHFVARGNTIINATMTYGFSIRSTVVVENANDNIISGATVGEYSIANNSWAPMKLTGPLNPGTIGAGTQPNGIWAGNGAPSNSFGADGDWYMRTGTPGTANQRLYVKAAGSWVGIL